MRKSRIYRFMDKWLWWHPTVTGDRCLALPTWEEARQACWLWQLRHKGMGR